MPAYNKDAKAVVKLFQRYVFHSYKILRTDSLNKIFQIAVNAINCNNVKGNVALKTNKPHVALHYIPLTKKLIKTLYIIMCLIVVAHNKYSTVLSFCKNLVFYQLSQMLVNI